MAGFTLADLLGGLLTRPLTGPQFGSFLPKSPTNARGQLALLASVSGALEATEQLLHDGAEPPEAA
jgi:hypothetical protein